MRRALKQGEDEINTAEDRLTDTLPRGKQVKQVVGELVPQFQ
jgi:hypothetical protein